MEKLERKRRLPLVYRIVFENLRHRRARTLLTALAIGMGVAMILAIVGISEGMMEDQRNRARGAGADLFILPPGMSALGLTSAPLPEKYVELIAEQPNVAKVAAMVMQPIERVNRVTGIEFDQFNAIANLQFNKGGPFQGDYDVIIDEYYARQNDLAVGDKIELLNRDWTICGIVEPGKMARVVVKRGILQKLTGTVGKITMVNVKVVEGADVMAVRNQLDEKLQSLQVLSVEELVSQFSTDSLPELQTFIAVITALSLAFGFLVIFLTMHTAVLERTREIGILKSLGASAGYILGIFVREAFALGALGTVAGILGSFVSRVLIGALIPASMQQSIVVAWWPIALAVTLFGCLLGVIYPAFKAAKQDALESLAYE